MTPSELVEALAHHERFLCGQRGGRRADLSLQNLSGFDLAEVNLKRAKLTGTDLSCCNLKSANLSESDLFAADLSGARLPGADLSGANLRGAYLRGADLSGADLKNADLRDGYLLSPIEGERAIAIRRYNSDKNRETSFALPTACRVT